MKSCELSVFACCQRSDVTGRDVERLCGGGCGGEGGRHSLVMVKARNHVELRFVFLVCARPRELLLCRRLLPFRAVFVTFEHRNSFFPHVNE